MSSPPHSAAPPAAAVESLSAPPSPRRGQGADARSTVSVAYDEYLDQLRAGRAVDPDEFCARFPRCRTALRSLIRAYHLLDEKRDEIDALVPAEELRPGGRFLQFRLIRELGRGAFSYVFQAAQIDLGGRPVAVKVTSRPAREAETLGPLIHPNIVPVHSVQRDPASGLTAVCMPYLGGATLEHVLDRAFPEPGQIPAKARVILETARDAAGPEAAAGGPAAGAVPEGRWPYVEGVAAIGAQLAEALAFIHARGVFHRDLKPSNVLLTPEGRPMLLDFNLADDLRFAPPELGGTVQYMSPEQLRATARDAAEEPGELGARADLFSLGVILYELLCGRHPFGPFPGRWGEAQVRAHQGERQRAGPGPLRRFNPAVPRSLARVIEGCLAYDPARRPRSAQELAAALRRCVGRAQRARRGRAWLCATGAALALAVAGANLLPLGGVSGPAAREEGWAAYRAGRYEEALSYFTQAAEADPNDAEAYFACGRAHQCLGDIRSARADYEAAYLLAPRGETAACLGFCANLGGEHTLALQYYTRAEQAGFCPAEVSNNMAYCYLKLGPQLNKARRAIDQAIRKNPDLPAAYHNRAAYFFNRAYASPGPDPHLLHRALADVELACRLGPPSPDLCALAIKLYESGAPSDPRGSAEKIRVWQQRARQLGPRPPSGRAKVPSRLADPLGEFRR
jgi:serine/threonine protein kinase